MTIRKLTFRPVQIAAIALLAMSGVAAAQSNTTNMNQPRAAQDLQQQPAAQPAAPVQNDAKADCAGASSQALPATAPQPGSDATAPGNSGTTGFTGGLGGSQIGTTPQGATPASKTWHAPTARGLDLAGRPEPVQETPNC
ncbi:hypothetical protein H4P12_10755 [Paracoccus sp. 11-3]|uniref:Uncharacterized protein n=1 Tax=Paracoccus amoyensis TaxID=2760093 RepID=A0A926GH61_9RHOB|nr:hypothetical protein [Paracoccus amoyensis]MBC9247184.1 hypothetical protein [Paracoccus amoyensis]